jgi:Rad3-related DNA helicase
MYVNNQSDSRLRQLLSLFPYEHPRPIQSAALDAVARMFDLNKRFSILEAPTGAGKSALAFTAARYAGTLNDLDDKFEPGAYILTPYNNLADEMISDFANRGLAALKGRRHYDPKSGAYMNAKAGFLESTESVTNYAYFLRARQAPKRQVLILDEGHNIERILLEMAGFRITSGICTAVGVDGPPKHLSNERIAGWLGAVLLPALRKQTSRRRESAALRELEDLAERVARYTGMDDRSQWVAWMDQGALNVKPLSAIAEARDLFARARHVLIQSATIFDFANFQRVLGISDSVVFSAPSDFPLCNRPIIYRPVGDMAFKSINGTIPGLCAEIERIVGSFGQCKGIIHTCTYHINQCVARRLAAKYGSQRIITHGQDPRDREQAIRLHCDSEGATVLVSPSLMEGVDLHGDLARFQIVCKVPYPRLDAYTRARSARDRAWYRLHTAWALVQMIGRAVRSDTDYATTFVLDSQFESFVIRNEEILPAWWRAAIQTEGKAA